MPYQVGFIDISGTYIAPPAIPAPLPSTGYRSGKLGVVTGSLNVRRGRQRALYDRLVTGNAFRFEVGESPDRTLSGNFGTVKSPAIYQNQKATVPSWTQWQVGKHHAFVMPALSSSDHEVSRLNAYTSGNLPLETSPVPASASFYYSKQQQLVYKNYKLSASIDLPVIPITLEQYPSTIEITTPRSIFDPVSGSYRNNSYFNPSIFQIFIPDYGKIRDLKVWVEFIHDIRGGSGTLGTAAAYQKQGLQGVQVALRSPNVTFPYAHPLWNSAYAQGFLKRPDPALTGSSQQFASFYQGVPELLKNSYLLWAGHQVEDDLGISLGSSTGSVKQRDTVGGYNPLYAEWDTDIDMRTVFWDGAPIPNPRDLSSLFPAPSDVSPGVGSSLLSASTILNPSPNYQAINVASGSGIVYNGLTGSVGGLNFPWFYDPRVQPGAFVGKNASVFSGTLPQGWLTSGTAGIPAAAPGEFPTATGSNLGPAAMRAVYPILDDIFVEKKYDETDVVSGTPTFPTQHPKVVGFRPGLRGTEIHGLWQLMVGVDSTFDPVNGMIGHPRAGIWFRQFRLEFILDQGQAVTMFVPARSRKYSKPSYVPQRDGRRRVQLLSGSAEWDIGINYVFVQQDQDYGRTIGITDNTGSTPDFAVFTRLTGALADMLFASATLGPGSGTAHAIYSYLNNPTGTPYIPISSGSSIAPAFEAFKTTDLPTKSIISTIINPRPILPQAHTLKAATTRLGAAEKTSAAITNKLLLLRRNSLL